MRDEKNELTKKMNYIYCSVIIIFLFCVFVLRGMPGVVAWSLGKLIIGPIGMVIMTINLILLVRSIIAKRNVKLRMVAVALSAVIALPCLMLVNVIPMQYPVNINNEKPSASVTYPIAEESVIGWGGDDIENNAPHTIWASERWAYDIVMEPYDLGSVILEDYGIYGKDVFSPVSGRVIASYDLEEDIMPGTEEFLSIEGNYVYLEIDETGTYLLMNHLKQGSVSVKVGDRVKEGDFLGKVGNSGSTSEPHLHIHHQRQNPTNTLHPVLAEGLPLYFNDINGKNMPVKGDVIPGKSN